MAESEEKFILTLSVNRKQKEEIEQFLNDKKWNDVLTGSTKEVQKQKKRKTAPSTNHEERNHKPVTCISNTCTSPLQREQQNSSDVPIQREQQNSSDVPVQREQQNSSDVPLQREQQNSSDVPLQREQQNSSEEGDRRCPYCFISPCVALANRTAGWIGNGQEENIANSAIRKRIYKRFWKIMANNGAWTIPEYIEKKIRIGGGDWVLTHQRELMPECIVNLARQLYPNPKTIPYMNHMWE